MWEANHVWLILALVLLFSCFPAAFAQLSIRLHIPLSLALIGIVLRGSAFAFRNYGGQRDDVQENWGRLFAIASVVTPVVLGMVVGAVATGKVGEGGEGRGTGFTPSMSRRGSIRLRSLSECSHSPVLPTSPRYT